MIKNMFLYTIYLLCIISIYSCSEKEYSCSEKEEEFAKTLFDVEALVLNSASHEISVKINKITMPYFFYRLCDYPIADSITIYEVKHNNDTITGDWFSVFIKDNNIHINTENNSTIKNRRIRLIFGYGQASEGFDVIQKKRID